MTKLLDQALEAGHRPPSEARDEVARARLTLAGEDRELEDIPASHLQDVLKSLEQAKSRQFATDAEIAAAFRCFES